jgi:hypothetical protein
MALHLSLDGLGSHVGEELELHEVIELIDWVGQYLVAGEVRLLRLLRTDQAYVGIKNLNTES